MAALKRARLLCLLLSIACVGTESPSSKATGGTLVISTGGDPDILIPSLLSSVQAAQITDLIYDRLAMIGDSLSIVNDAGFTPQLADRWTWGRGFAEHCLSHQSPREMARRHSRFARATCASPSRALPIPLWDPASGRS